MLFKKDWTAFLSFIKEHSTLKSQLLTTKLVIPLKMKFPIKKSGNIKVVGVGSLLEC
jgi:hypothetical protein